MFWVIFKIEFALLQMCGLHAQVRATFAWLDILLIENWFLKSKILNFAEMLPPHSGVELAIKLFEFFKDWGTEKKIFSLTLDNASNNDNMQDIMKEQLSLHDSLLWDGEFFWTDCSAHILDLIIQECLKVASDALHKIREFVK